jgi:hypothetical protein
MMQRVTKRLPNNGVAEKEGAGIIRGFWVWGKTFAALIKGAPASAAEVNRASLQKSRRCIKPKILTLAQSLALIFQLFWLKI